MLITTSRSEPESQYLDLLRNILQKGDEKPNRTDMPTMSLFGQQMRFDLRGGKLPLLTTKKMAYRLIVEELLWFLSGSSDSKVLSDKKVHIWDSNSSRSNLDKLGFGERREGDCGANYGFQWRHFGAKYIDCDTDYAGQGVDQVVALVNNLKSDPYSRRHILSAWNPADLNNTVLPPCHVMTQFNVTSRGELDCSVYQRSADVPLGVPFNIASYATLTHMVAQQVGLEPGDFVYTTGDTHIYKNQVPQCQEQVLRNPFPAPTLEIDTATSLFDYKWENFHLRDYRFHPAIAFEMIL